jgi:tetratricopeptide (TPR) repeat protein
LRRRGDASRPPLEDGGGAVCPEVAKEVESPLDEVVVELEHAAVPGVGIALTYRAGFHIHAAEFAAASALIEEADAASEVAGTASLPHAAMVLAAWRGQEAPTLALIEASIKDAAGRGEGRVISLAEYVRAVLYNGQGRYEDALAAAHRASEHDDLGILSWILIELVEASTRVGDVDAAARGLERVEERTHAGGSEWALGIQAWSRALVNAGHDTDALYREAIERLARTRVAVHLARTQLVYGEWLRRGGRRADAREQLRAAHDTFSRIGAEGFAERAGVRVDDQLGIGQVLRQEERVDGRDHHVVVPVHYQRGHGDRRELGELLASPLPPVGDRG